jgi:imidazolonepropionase-like amidohydrolase
MRHAKDEVRPARAHALLFATILAFASLPFAYTSSGAQLAGAKDLPTADLAIVNARIYPAPDAVPIDHGTVLIHAGKITAVSGSSVRIPVGADTIDAGGAVVTAGFWNSHVHILTPTLLHAQDHSAEDISRELQALFTRWGFTTVFDLASSLQNTNTLRERIRTGEVTGPRILTVGDPFFPAGGTPIYVRQFLQDNGFPSEEVALPATAAARARRQLEAGADGVKIFAGAIVGGDIGVLPMPLDIARAAVQEAHRAGKPAFAHPSDARGIEVSIESGVDVLTHTAPEMGPWNAELVARLRAHRMALMPTLTLFKVEMEKKRASAEEIEQTLGVAAQQVKIFSRSGGQILFGTDLGYIDVDDTTDEYRLMSRSLDWRQILASLTTSPAQRFDGGGKSGRLTVGAVADLVVLEADPARDITGFAHVRCTIKDGRVIYRSRDMAPR